MSYFLPTGTLNVYLNNSGNPTLIWTLTGNQGNNWNQGKLPISAQTGSFMVSD